MIIKDGELLKVEENDIKNGTFTKWRGITSIGINAFAKLSSLEKITIPSSVKEIKEGAFNSCVSLRKVHLPRNLKVIEKNMFLYTSINKIILPRNLKIIKENAFAGCIVLRKINFSNNIIEIRDSAFSQAGLKKVILPKKLKILGENAFSCCSSLEEIKLSNNIKEIKRETFRGCLKLQNIKLPSKLEKINGRAFVQCGNLSVLKLPKGLKEISSNAFNGCGIVTLNIPKKHIEKIEENAFNETHIGNLVKGMYSYSLIDYMESFVTGNYEMNYTNIIIFLNNTEDEFIPNSVIFPLHFVASLSKEEMNRVLKPESFKHFKNIYDEYEFYINEGGAETVTDFYKFAYVLGCFNNEEVIIGGRKVNLAQKASVFLKQLLDSEQLKFDDSHDLFDNLEIQKYNLDLIKFLTEKEKNTYQNFKYLHSYGRTMSKIINNFDKIANQVVIDSKGRIIQNPSYKRRIETYLNQTAFENVQKGNEDLLKEFSKFHAIEQPHFDNAQIIKEKGKDAPNHILNEELKEEIIIESIEKIKSKIKKETLESKKLIDELIDKEFTYEWLDKHDPKNFTLGLYCDCCASIVSTYYGKRIMEASITRDDVQNMIIRNNFGEVIAKATIYVNKEKGYAVFNDIEMKRIYGNEASECDISDNTQRVKIYNAFKRGMHDFVEKYNSINKETPITQVNVGWTFNRLKQVIKSMEEKSEQIFEVPEYFNDAKNIQWVVYRA